MTKQRFVYWLPRFVAVLIVAFFALFILEGFSPEFSWVDSLMHSLLALVALTMTVVAWKWPKVGGWFFVLLGARFLVPSLIGREVSGLVIGGVPVAAGILFLIEGFKNGKHQANS
jgi:predicted tellurium resistance membrane protein TerC